MKNCLKIGVVIPVYNGQEYIGDALKSVAGQTLPPDEVIVVDDGSTDNTSEIVKSFSAFLKISYYRKTNGGLSSARNLGIEKSSADLIAFLDADDIWVPEKLEKQVEVFLTTKTKRLGVVFCKYGIVDSDGCLTDQHYIFDPGPEVRGLIFNRLLASNCVAGSGSGVLVKRECFSLCGGFDEGLTACEDWDMWLRIARAYEFDFVPCRLVNIRRHSQNMQKDSMKMLINHLRFFDKWAHEAAISKKCLCIWRGILSRNLGGALHSFKKVPLFYRLLSESARKEIFRHTFGSPFLWIFLRRLVH